MSNIAHMPASLLTPIGGLGSIEAYINYTKQIPKLTQAEEQVLLQRWFDTGCLASVRQLIISHLAYVVHIARGYLGYGLPFADLIQEGNVGLMKAVKRFVPTFKVRLITYAVHWIKAEIQDFILKNRKLVKSIRSKQDKKLFFNLKKWKKDWKWLSQAEINHIAKALDLKPKQVEQMDAELHQTDLSIDDDSQENGLATTDHYLVSHHSNPMSLLSKENDEQLQGRLAQALQKLQPRLRMIVEQRWLATPTKTLSELSSELGISIERVRQLANDGLAKLRLELSS